MFRRIALIVCTLFFSVALVSTVLVVLKNNISFFVIPSELDHDKYQNKKIRVGGMLNEESVKYTENGLEFIIYDQTMELKVILKSKKKPPVFKGGEQVILLGILDKGIFIAEKAISKHDERYYPEKS